MRNLYFFFLCLMVGAAWAQDPWRADEYFLHSSSQREAASDLMKYVPLQGNEKVLDVGCGEGKITAELVQKLPKGSILGIDISPSMIEFAQKHFSFPGSAIEFMLKDAQEMNFSSKFDVILSFTALQWIGSHEKFLSRAYESLNPSGRLAVTMPMGLPDALEQAVLEVVAFPRWAAYFENFLTGWNFATEEGYEKLLVEAGFKVSRCEAVPQKDVFPSREAFEKFISQWFPYLRPLPESEKASFLKEVLDRYLAFETPFPAGEVHFKIRRLESVAMKGGDPKPF